MESILLGLKSKLDSGEWQMSDANSVAYEAAAAALKSGQIKRSADASGPPAKSQRSDAGSAHFQIMPMAQMQTPTAAGQFIPMMQLAAEAGAAPLPVINIPLDLQGQQFPVLQVPVDLQGQQVPAMQIPVDPQGQPLPLIQVPASFLTAPAPTQKVSAPKRPEPTSVDLSQLDPSKMTPEARLALEKLKLTNDTNGGDEPVHLTGMQIAAKQALERGQEATHHHAVVSPWAKPEHREQLVKEASGADKREKEAEKKKQARAPISARRHIGDGIVAGRGGGGNHLERARQAGVIRN
jgi:hypothetical protein